MFILKQILRNKPKIYDNVELCARKKGVKKFGSHIKNLVMKTIAERSAVQVNIDTITNNLVPMN